MGVCGCFDRGQIISKNQNNNINQIIEQVDDSIIKLNEINNDPPITQKGKMPIYENIKEIKNEKKFESEKTIGNELKSKKNHKKKMSNDIAQNENENNDIKKNNNENIKKKNKTNKIETQTNNEEEKNNNDNNKNNNNEKKKEKKKETNPNKNKQYSTKKEESEKEINEIKNEKKKLEEKKENKLIDNGNNENNINNTETKKTEILHQNETDISLYRYPSNFEIIYQSSSILKGKTEINIVLIGEKQSGKSSFVIKLAENRFENLYIPTVFIETISKVMTYNNKRYVLNFDVTPGEQEYQQDYSTLYAKSNFIFLFYDVTNLGSFTRAKKYIKKELKNKVIIYANNFSNIFIIGNKIDCTPFIESSTQIKSYCEKHQLEFFEISVKTNAGIGYMMNKLLAIFDSISSI